MNRKKTWIDDPTLLPGHLEAVKAARDAQVAETKTWGSMLINRPSSFSRTGGPGGHMVLSANDVIELGQNVFHEAARTARAQVCKPLDAVAVSVGGNYDQQMACDSATQWLRGALQLLSFHEVATDLTTMAMWATESHAVIAIDPVTQDPTTTILDPTEGFWTSDRTEFVCSRAVPRRWLRATYAKGNPELKAAIDHLPQWSPDAITGVDADDQFATEDTVRLFEAWVEPVGDEPGRHVVMASPHVVFVDDDKFEGPIPVVSTNWSPGARGRSDGAPLGRIVGPYHCWLNKLTHKVYEALKGAVPWVVGPPGTKMPSDAPYQFVEEDPNNGGAVKVEVPKVLSAEVLGQIKDLRGDSLRAAGISEEASQGSPPASLKSGVAISKWQAVIEGSLSQQHAAYKRLWIDAAKILLALARKAYQNRPVNVRRAQGTDVIEQVRWKDINLPEDSFTVDFDAVNALGDNIPQRIENGQVLKELGAIDLGQFLYHVDIPDLRALTKRVTGPQRYIEYQVNLALRHGKVEPPMDLQDAKAGLRQVTESYLAALAAPVRPPRQNLEACRVLLRLFRRLAQAAPQAQPDPAVPSSATPAAA